MQKYFTSVKTFFMIFFACFFFFQTQAYPVDTFQPVFRPSLIITKTDAPINIDGKLDDPGWKFAKRINQFVERYPGENTKPDVQTEVAITYNAKNLYIAFICYDDPTKIRATMCQRDQFSNNDNVIVLIDTYGDASWAYEFLVNPYGVQKDYLWSSIAGEDPGYDLIWESAAQKTDSGYQVEIAIPFESLRFPNKDVQTWKMDFWRNHPRESYKQYSWSANDRNEKCWPCQWGTIEGIRDVYPGTGIEILPALVAHQSGSLSDFSNPNSSFHNNKPKGELSLSGKYPISSDMTIEAAYNPDFSQIEADAAQIDVNSTIALWYPERRPFFQEGSDIFRTLFQSFYTRTVNDPQFATKFTGRMNRTSLGYIMALDENTPYIIPRDESSIMLNSGRSFVNIFRGLQTFGDDSKIGIMVSDRRFEKKGSGTTISIDGDIRLSNNYSIDGQFIATHTKEPNDTLLTSKLKNITFDRGKYTAAFDGESFYGNAFITRFKRRARNWNFTLNYNQIDPSYRTEVGYDPVNNHRTYEVYTSYNIYPEKSIFTRITPQAYNFGRWNYNGIKKRDIYAIGCDGQINIAQTYFNISYNQTSVLFNNVKFNNLWEVEVDISSRLSNIIGFGMGIDYGRGIAYYAMAKGNETSIYANIYLKPIDRLTIDHNLNFLRSTDINTGEKFFSGYISRTKIQFQFNRELSLRLVAQYNDFRKSWDVDPLITYRLSSFSVLYVGSTYDYQKFNENPEYSSSWEMTSRQFFLKLQYLFQI